MLAYDKKIEQEAQEWADHLAMVNDGLDHELMTPYGENLGYRFSSSLIQANDAIQSTVTDW